MKSIAKVISLLFHPIFLYTYLYIIYKEFYSLYNSGLNATGEWLLIGLVFFNTAVLPVILLLIARKNLLSSDLKERRTMLMLTAIIYSITYILFSEELFGGAFMRILLLANIVGLLIAHLVNRTFKLSLHMLGMGGASASLLFAGLYLDQEFAKPLLWSFVIGGLVGSARLVLKVHKPAELMWGYLAGFLGNIITLFVAYSI